MTNLIELAQEIRKMTRQQNLYKVLRDELSARGYWTKRPRGDPKKGYQAMKNKVGK
jgi:hypothetical protein